jgi:cobalt/nickel transport system ATP-binding protein
MAEHPHGESALIAAEALSFSHPGRPPVLHGLDFALRPGERVGIIGPTGSGKSTFLHLLMGLLVPSAGTVAIFGRRMHGENDFRSVRTRLGFLFQDADDQLFSPSLLEDAAFGPLNQGCPPAEAEARAREALHRVGMADAAERFPGDLSGGEKRLAALATVLAMRPEILLLDEPLTGLDPAMRARLIQLLGDLALPAVVVSHDWDFLASYATRTCLLADGILRPAGLSAPHSHVHVHPGGTAPHGHGDA